MTDDTHMTRLNGKVVKGKRKSLNLTQKEVAQYMGVTDAAVSQWERGGGIDVQKLRQLGRVLNTTVDELISRDQNANRNASARITDSVNIIDRPIGNRVPLVALRGLTVDNMVARRQESLAAGRITPEIALSDNSIAFAMADQSMEPEYQIAEIVTVDRLDPEPGDHILAHIKTEDATVFRVFEFDGADYVKLLPINAKFRVLRFSDEEWKRDVEVIGVMVSHIRSRRARNTI